MSVFIANMIECYEFNRTRTLDLLSSVEQEDNAGTILGWRPATGRAHIAWQFMHIGITEEIFASERLSQDKPQAYLELWPRFRGGSVPDDRLPSVGDLREVLAESRLHLIDTLQSFTDDDLLEIPEGFKERGLPLRTVLQIIAWHEAHHQGQAHLTFNLYKATR